MKRRRWILTFALATLLAGCGSGYRPVSMPPTVVDAWPVVRVVDGDTIRVRYEGREEPVRLLCIDTPERGESGFEEATEAMRGLVEGREVVLEFERPGEMERDRYGRLLAYVFWTAAISTSPEAGAQGVGTCRRGSHFYLAGAGGF